jgi:signal transduction histidine kinase
MSQTVSLGASRPIGDDTLPGRRGIHPIVKLDYAIRVPAALLMAGILISIAWGPPHNSLLLYLSLVYGIVWPHVGYIHARLRSDSKSAEHANLMFESFLLGFFSTLISFQLWPFIAFFAAANSANLAIGGRGLVARGIVSSLVGTITGGLIAGFHFSLASGPVTTVLSILTILVYTTLFALHSNQQTKNFLRAKQELTARHQEIAEQHAELQLAWSEAEQQRTAAEEARRAAEEARASAEEARSAAEAANQAKSSFLANMSHELRTPLNAIIGYSEMLVEDAADAGNEDLVPDLDRIRTAGKHLLGLINNVLDLSKIEAGKMALFIETFSIEELVSEVVDTARPLIEKRGNRFDVRVQPYLGNLKGDVTKLKQVLLNLLSNASKFTENGVVTLEVNEEYRPQLGTAIAFRVRDTGIGMTDEQMAKLFEAFTQADASTTRKYGGTGLGLAISRRFCQLMGGDIAVTSEYGRGSTFSVHLPSEVGNAEGEASRIFRVQSVDAIRKDQLQ